MVQIALQAIGVEHVYVRHFGASIPFHPDVPGSPLAGIYIGDASGVGRAELV